MSEAFTLDNAKSLRRISYALLSAIFLIPISCGLLDQNGSGRYGEIIGQGLAILGLLAVTAWLITRKKSPITQDSVRLAVTGAIFIWVIMECISEWHGGYQLRLAAKNVENLYSPQSAITSGNSVEKNNLNELPEAKIASQPQRDDRAAGAALINKVVALQKLHNQEMQKLDGKFNALPMTTVLAAETLTSKERISDAKNNMHHFISLIKERRNLIAKNYADSEKLLNGIDDPTERAKAFEPFNKNKARQFPLYQKLDEAQLAVADTGLKILAVAESALGKTTLKDGQILFQNQTQLDTFNGLMNQLSRDSQKEDAAIKALTEALRDQQQSIQADLKKINR